VDRLLCVTQVAPYLDGPAGVHGVLDQASTAVFELANMNDLDALRVSDVSELSPDEIDRSRVLALFTIGETPWTEAQRAAILDGVRSGRTSVVAIHAATDSCHGWDDYLALVGARFDGHPWTQTFDMDVVDTTHPATRHLGPRWSWRDEVYLFRDLRPDARILLRVSEGQLDMSVDGARRPAAGFPLAWCFTEGRGRAFYTSLGHFPGAWESPVFLRHLAGGLAWALGEGE
jgi:type 1 glutamine amidotransferase